MNLLVRSRREANKLEQSGIHVGSFMVTNSTANDHSLPAGDVLARIDRLPAFAAWPVALKKRLAEVSYLRNHARGKKILACGEECADLLVIQKGTLVTYRCSLDGRQNVMFYWHRNDLLGLAPIFGGGPFSFDLYAQSQVSLLYIPASTVLAVIGENPRLVAGLLEVIHRRYRLTIEMFCRQTLMPLRERMIDRLIFLAETQGRPAANGILLDIRLSQEDLAAMLSATRQSVNRELRWLVEQKLIVLAYNSITITDLDGLHALCEAHPMLPIHSPGGQLSPLSLALSGNGLNG